MLAEAGAVDAREDRRFGDRRGDELPEGLTGAADRRARLAACKEKLARRGAGAGAPPPGEGEGPAAGEGAARQRRGGGEAQAPRPPPPPGAGGGGPPPP